MRLDVAGGSYLSAAEALVTANQLSAGAYSSLTAALTGYAAMAGDDATSADFASGYDAAARDAVPAVADLVDAFASLSGLTLASVDNHRAADAASVYRRPRPVTTSTAPFGGGPVAVPTVALPSSLGSDDPDLPAFWNEVMDHLEGWAWPSADCDTLRQAAATWRDAAGDLERLDFYCDTATLALSAQRSPEIPLATEAIGDLRRCANDLATQLRDIGDACEDYATQVETTRETVRGVLRDLAIELSLYAAAAVFTAGGTAALALTRILTAARTIVTALRALKTTAWACAITKLTLVAWRITPLRTVLLRLKRGGRLGRPGAHLPARSRPPGAGPGWQGRVADNGRGDVWQRPGAIDDIDSMRLMDPTRRYPDGYTRFVNSHNQPLGLDGKPGSQAETHIPRRRDGTYPLPDGWSR